MQLGLGPDAILISLLVGWLLMRRNCPSTDASALPQAQKQESEDKPYLSIGSLTPGIVTQIDIQVLY